MDKKKYTLEDHMKYCAEEVKTWPLWQQKIVQKIIDKNKKDKQDGE